MIKLEEARRRAGWSQRELARRAKVDPSYISNAESRGFILYRGQSSRVADALGWDGDPAELFEEVKDDEPSHS